ncbi:MAG: type VI secretion system tip protein VgrG [Azoarcus sp.]|jgi:type VI secretion system secreted protein VgrG|nr:type VI secretion system tip protein VgrG [Azoarcus sp.]
MEFRSLKAARNSLDNMTPLEKLSAALPGMPYPALEKLLAAFASAFTQDNRLVRLRVGDGEAFDERLLPQLLEGREMLSEPYKYELLCLSPDAFIPLERLLGQDVQIDILTGLGKVGDFHAGSPGQITRCGLITEVRSLSSDGGFARYKLIIESPLALLRHRTASRVFQDVTVPEIVERILQEHIDTSPAIGRILTMQFNLNEQYPARSYCLQYRETDLAFIERLLFEEGIGYTHAHESGDVGKVAFIAFDDPWELPQADQGTVRFHRADATEMEDSLTGWTQMRRIGPGGASLTSYDYKLARANDAYAQCRAWLDEKFGEDGEVILPAESSLEDFDAQTLCYGVNDNCGGDLYRYAELRRAALDRRKSGYQGEGNVRGLLAGQWFELTEHPFFQSLPEEECAFVACELVFYARNNLPQGLASTLAPLPLPAFGPPLASGELPPPYWMKISARKRGLPLTPAYAHTKHAKPTALGVQTATVTGSEGEEVYTDEMGRVKIQFHWQRPKEHPAFGANFDERSSCWVRVATPGAGAAWGHQSIPRIGQEVLVCFLEHDIDRPVISGVIHNGNHSPPWYSGAGKLPYNKALTGIKTKEHHGRQYGELLFDDTRDQVRTKLSSEHGKTQLNQGFLTHARRDGSADPRGDGFELRTDRHGAIRAGDGLLISTEAKLGADGKQLDRKAAEVQLEATRKAAQSLADAAEGQGADAMETGPEARDEEGRKQSPTDTGHLEHLVEALKSWEADTNTDPEGSTASGGQSGRQPVLLLSGAEGIGLVTPKEMVLTSGTNLDMVSQNDTQQTSARRWIHNVGKKISFFVHGVAGKFNLKLIAAKGHALLHAQSGDVEIVGDQNLRLYASKKKTTIAAGEELLLACGGATIRLKGGNIDIHCPGKVSVKGANHNFSGSASLDEKLPGVAQGRVSELDIPDMLDFSG